MPVPRSSLAAVAESAELGAAVAVEMTVASAGREVQPSRPGEPNRMQCKKPQSAGPSRTFRRTSTPLCKRQMRCCEVYWQIT
jgi:hypothetical protein